MSIDSAEEGDICDYCGEVINFFDDDHTVCPNCGSEFYNMDYHGEEPGTVDDIFPV
ncbi:MAG: zinc-ribbon domain [Actinomycetota bacterium]|jgi:predicted amidophosphoribosyltransferase